MKLMLTIFHYYRTDIHYQPIDAGFYRADNDDPSLLGHQLKIQNNDWCPNDPVVNVPITVDSNHKPAITCHWRLKPLAGLFQIRNSTRFKLLEKERMWIGA